MLLELICNHRTAVLHFPGGTTPRRRWAEVLALVAIVSLGVLVAPAAAQENDDFIAGPSASTSEPSMEDVAAEGGLVAKLEPVAVPLTFEERIEAADLIAYGRIGEASPEAIELEVTAFDHVFELLSVFKGSADAAVPVVDPRWQHSGYAESWENPALEPGAEYVLFLRLQPELGAYSLLGGVEENQAIDHRLRTPSGETVGELGSRIRAVLGLSPLAGSAGGIEELAMETLTSELPSSIPSKNDDAKLPRPGPGAESADRADAKAIQTILYQSFEGAFPGPWSVFDNNGSVGGQVYWDDTSYRSAVGNWSAGCADGGANASPPGTSYSNNMSSWMRYGPFDLSNATGGSLSFRYWNSSELNFDYFKYMVSINGTNYYGYHHHGNSGGWRSRTIDFTNVPYLGDVTGDSSVWIAFVFTSDSSITYEGAYVDEVRIRKTVPAAADLSLNLVNAPSGTYAPGDSITIHNIVQNIGGASSTPYQITFYASTNTTISPADHQLGIFNRGGLAPSASHNYNTTFNLPGSLPNGTYHIGAILTVADANSSNNSNYDPVPITVAAGPDLALNLIDVASGLYAPGASITIHNIVQNVGSSSSPGYQVRFYASTNTTISTLDHQIGLVSRSGLVPGGVHNYNTIGSLPGSLPGGTYYIGAILTVTDTNSSNNSNFDPGPITVMTAAADLALQTIDCPPGPYLAGDPMTIHNIVQNVGGASSTGYRITFYASTNTTISTLDYQIGFIDRSGLAPSGVHNYYSTGSLPTYLDGMYYIGAILTISDANSSNNTNFDPLPVPILGPVIFVDGFESGSTFWWSRTVNP